MHFITLAGHKTCLNCWLIQTPDSSVASPTVSPTSGRENTNKHTKEEQRGLERRLCQHQGASRQRGRNSLERQTLARLLEEIHSIPMSMGHREVEAQGKRGNENLLMFRSFPKMMYSIERAYKVKARQK